MDTKVRILIVDDDVNICQLIMLYLEKEGYESRAVYNGKQALEVFREFTPNLVVLDIMLPGMDGWQVCREIRKFSSIPIIMLSARDETFDKVLGLELGADDYVVKPFEPKELVARIKAVLRRYDSLDSTYISIAYYNKHTFYSCVCDRECYYFFTVCSNSVFWKKKKTYSRRYRG
jgi:two-component system OmpR family response regulator